MTQGMQPKNEENCVSEDDGSNRPPLEKSARKITDVWACCLYFLYAIAMVFVAYIGFKTGDGTRLIYGTDYLGNTCGSSKGCVGNGECGQNIYYPRQGMDSILQGFANSAANVNSVKLLGICLDSCPTMGSFVCKYEQQDLLNKKFENKNKTENFLYSCMEEAKSQSKGIANLFGVASDAISEECKPYVQNCWQVASPQANIFWRCLGDSSVERVKAATCGFPLYQDKAETIKMPYSVCKSQLNDELFPSTECVASTCPDGCVENPKCQIPATHIDEILLSIPGETIVSEQLGSWTMTIYRYFGELEYTLTSILVTGLVGGVVFGVLWLILLKYFVEPFVWLMIVAGFLVLVLGTLFCFVLAGTIPSDWLWKAYEITGATKEFVSDLTKLANADPGLWGLFAWVGFVLCILYLVLIVAFRTKVKFAVEIYEESSRALLSMPDLMLVPFSMCVLTVALFCYFAVVFGYVFTSGDLNEFSITLSNFSDTLSSLSNQNGRRLIVGVEDIVPNSTVATEKLASSLADVMETLSDPERAALSKALDYSVYQVDGGSEVSGMLILHTLGVLWTYYLIQCAGVATLSLSVCFWYWTRVDKSKVKIRVLGSWLTMMRYHFGSLCLGSLLLSMFQLLRLLIDYFYKQTKKLQDQNSVVKCIVKCCMSCTACLHKVIRYLTFQSFTMTAMYGYGFCEAGLETFLVLKKDKGRVFTVAFVGTLILNLSKVIITVICVLIEKAWLENDADFAFGGPKYIESTTLTLIMTAGLAFWIATGFMVVYQVASKTLLMCVCVDADINRQNKNYYMSKDLKQLCGRRRKSKRRTRKKPAAVKPNFPGQNEMNTNMQAAAAAVVNA